MKKYFLPVCLITGTLLRLFQLDAFGLWVDEKHTLLNAQGLTVIGTTADGTTFSPNELENQNTLHNALLANTSDNGGNNVLYILILHMWVSLFGDTDFVLRLPSVIFSVLAICFVYLLAKQLSSNDTRKVVIITLLFTFGSLGVAYAQEARAYALLLLAGSASAYYTVLFRLHQRLVHASLLALFFAIGVFTHFNFIFLVLLLAAYLVLFGTRNRRFWLLLAGGFVFNLICILVWYYSIGKAGLEVAAQNSARIANVDGPITPYLLLSNSFVTLLALLGNQLVRFGIPMIVNTAFFLIPLAALSYFLLSLRNKDKSTLFLFLFALAIPIVLSVVIASTAMHYHIFKPKYWIAFYPITICLLGFAVDYWLRGTMLLKTIAIASLVVFCVSVVQVFTISVVYAPGYATRIANPVRTQAQLVSKILLEYPATQFNMIVPDAFAANELYVYLNDHIRPLSMNVNFIVDATTQGCLTTNTNCRDTTNGMKMKMDFEHNQY